MSAASEAKSLVEQAWREAALWESNYRKAQALLEAAAADDPGSAVLLTCLGAVYCDRGSHREADSALKRAIDLGTDDRNAFFNRAVALMNLGESKRAERLFKKAAGLAASPETWAAHFDAHGH